MKETMEEIKKVWGKELVIANCDEYCGKLLYLDKGAKSSYHYHKQKQETFYCIDGQAALTIEGKDYMLNPFSRPKTIRPGQKHSFMGIANSVIIEISTHHDDSDVVRLTQSEASEFCPKLDECPKIRMVLDKDMLDFQYSESIREICAKCSEGEVFRMVKCPKCGAAMLRAELYDPEGTAPLYGGIRSEKSWWVCINPECEDGKRNRQGVISKGRHQGNIEGS